jgi:hypothetical protein
MFIWLRIQANGWLLWTTINVKNPIKGAEYLRYLGSSLRSHFRGLV